jgi:predicted ATPase
MKGRCIMYALITVKNLFGNGKKIVINEVSDPWIPNYRHDPHTGNMVKVKTLTRARILTGINGFGKTTIFNIISDIFGNTSFNDEYYKNIHFDEFKMCTDSGYIVIKHPGADTEFMIRSNDRGNPIVERLYIKYDPNDKSDVAIRKNMLKKHHFDHELRGIRNVIHIRDDRFAYIHESTKSILHRINESEYKQEIYERLKKIIDKRTAYTPVTLNDIDGKIRFLEPIEIIPKAILDEFNIFAEVIMSSISGGNIVLIDTPETSKHIAIQEMFMSDLMNDDTYLHGKQYSPQIIIATHSPYIVGEYSNLVLSNKVFDIKSKTK